jgi:hypothetical protein
LTIGDQRSPAARRSSASRTLTFPFPDGLTPNVPAGEYASNPRAIAIEEAARYLDDLRQRWLNPPEWVRREPGVAELPDRLVPANAEAAEALKKRTLTNLYNAKPAWLVHAHERLDEAVAGAYGWSADIGEEDVLRRLFELNLARVHD